MSQWGAGERMLMDLRMLCGLDDRHIDTEQLERPVHREVVAAWRALCADAEAAGFRPAIASGFRSHARQLTIWNEKATGRRPLLDSAGQPLDRALLDNWGVVQAILRWSALPGASRHHWGTELDVWDRAAVPPAYQLQLTPAEVADDGPFGPFHRWLDQRISAGQSHGFFRPYASDRGGIAPERWHLSYAPLAAACQQALTAERLRAVIEASNLALREIVLAHWPEIFDRFVTVPVDSYPAPWRQQLTG